MFISVLMPDGSWNRLFSERYSMFWRGLVGDVTHERWPPLTLRDHTQNTAQLPHECRPEADLLFTSEITASLIRLLSWLDWTWQFSRLFYRTSQIKQELTHTKRGKCQINITEPTEWNKLENLNEQACEGEKRLFEGSLRQVHNTLEIETKTYFASLANSVA